MKSVSSDTLGIIAGSRELPLRLAQEAKKMGVRHVAAVAFHNETDPSLAQCVDSIDWIRVGQLSALIEHFKKRGIRQCVMAGQIAPNNLYSLRPDFRAFKLLFRLKERNAHSLFGGIAEELSKEGIELIDASPWLQSLMPGAGYHVGKPLTPALQADIDYGRRIASDIARLDIGQCVVVKKGTVLAVEGFEGTDACLERGGTLAGKTGGAVAVKLAKSNHDMRFDIPCIGPHTIEICGKFKVRALAIEAGRSLILNRDKVESQVRKNRFTLTALNAPERSL